MLLYSQFYSHLQCAFTKTILLFEIFLLVSLYNLVFNISYKFQCYSQVLFLLTHIYMFMTKSIFAMLFNLFDILVREFDFSHKDV